MAGYTTAGHAGVHLPDPKLRAKQGVEWRIRGTGCGGDLGVFVPVTNNHRTGRNDRSSPFGSSNDGQGELDAD